MQKECTNCRDQIDILNKKCSGCGFHIVLEPDEARKAKYLRTPSFGGLLFTQGWTLGARLYLPFALSLIPVVGIVILVFAVLFGRRFSWKYGGWASWDEFTARMRLLDLVGIVWVVILVSLYFIFRN
ncbi:MAG: hypothetical protein ABIH21_04355 [Patescibacteria group bacterium]